MLTKCAVSDVTIAHFVMKLMKKLNCVGFAVGFKPLEWGIVL